MSIIKYILNTDPVIILLLFCLLLFTIKHTGLLNASTVSTQGTGYNIIIQIEQDNVFPVVCQFNKDTISKTPLPFPLRISEITNGRKYYIDKNHNIYNTSEISGKHKIALGMPININNATLTDLTAIPGIGNVTGKNIIDYRETFGKFKDLNTLNKVDGIGIKIFSKIKGYLSL